MTDDCEELHARADMLHREADLSRAKALQLGPAWSGFLDQVHIATRCEEMAVVVEDRIDETC